MIVHARSRPPLAALVLVAVLATHVLALASCAGAEADGAGGASVDLVPLTPEQRQRFDITVATAGPGSIDTFTELPGQVRPNGDKLAHIVARFPGVVREVRKTV